MIGRLLGCIAFGAVFAAPGIYYALRATRLRTWPSAPGRIVSCELTWDTGGQHIQLRPKVRYAYAVQGKSYEGTQLTMADWLYTTGIVQARSYARRFPVGKDVSVYYEPENHSKSVVVKPGFIAATVMIAMGVVTVYVLWEYGPAYGK